MKKKTPKDIVKDMLVRWGEYEALGLYAARAQRSMLGRIGDSRSTDGGRPLPFVWIPADVQEVSRLVALMREQCRAGETYFRLIRKRYVKMEEVGGRGINRAEEWLVKAWLDLR
jgi:hypothetical protein